MQDLLYILHSIEYFSLSSSKNYLFLMLENRHFNAYFFHEQLNCRPSHVSKSCAASFRVLMIMAHGLKTQLPWFRRYSYTPIVCVALYSALAFVLLFLLLLTSLIYLFIFQLFHLVSAKVLDSIRLIKIAQVIFYIFRPNYLML